MHRLECCCVLLWMLMPAFVAQASTLARDLDPVVLEGSDLPWLLGVPVGRVVAFRYQDGWLQIPVQIDERDQLDLYAVYGEDPIGLTTLAYTDPNTYAGPDSDPAFDVNDQLAFMVADAGASAPPGLGPPAGTVAGSGVELAISDPLDGGSGFVYLFETDGTLVPGAGVSYGTYTFDLLAGSYIPNYSTLSGPNPEDSSFVSSTYATHFSDRWIRDRVEVDVGGATGVDILDRHKNMFGPGVCTRTEDTFSDGEGAFFANKSGPVRSIRSYMGANSGPFTQRDHVFYRDRQDVFTYLRVHAISGVMDVYDYSPDAAGMTYFNDLNPSGVTVDGSPDPVTTGFLEWEMVTGDQGSLIILGAVDTDIPGFSPTSYYSDDATPGVAQCTGDAYEYATSGLWVDHGIPDTDPYGGADNYLTGLRIIYYLSPGQEVATADLHRERLDSPVQVAASEFLGESPVPLLPVPAWIALAALLLGLARSAATAAPGKPPPPR